MDLVRHCTHIMLNTPPSLNHMRTLVEKVYQRCGSMWGPTIACESQGLLRQALPMFVFVNADTVYNLTTALKDIGLHT